jgi:SAM-dependent methyltransferase
MTGPPPPYSPRFESLVRRMHAGAESAPGYASWIADHLGRRIEEIETRVLPSLRRFTSLEGRRVLDFGSGTGSSAVALVRAGCRVTGVDPDPESCRMARMRLAEHGLEAEILHVADTSRLPFEEGFFDIVLANGVFEHIRRRERSVYLDEAWRVLGPGGVLYVAETPNRLLPFDFHTTGLLWLPWLPPGPARRYAIWRGRIPAGMDLELAGYRGMTWREFRGYLRDKPHRVLNDTAQPDDLDFFRAERFGRGGGAGKRLGRWIFYLTGKGLKALGVSPRHVFPNVEGAVRKQRGS